MTFHINPEGSTNKYVAEFLGTFVLVLTIGLNVDGSFKVLSIASALVIMIFAMGPVSGGHFNPAVTLTVLLNKKIEIVDAIIYVISQILGAQAARGLVWQMKGGEFDFHPSYNTAFPWQVFFAEFAYTTVLCYVVLNAACRKEPNPAFGLAIGLVIVAGGYSVGNISGGAFNPAVASTFNINCVPVCLVAEFLASFLASLLFSLVYDADEVASGKIGLRSQLMSEFIGTFVLVMTVGFNVMGASPAGALSIGMSLTVMIFEDHGVSGGHLNPAVTSAISARTGSDRAGKSFELYALVQLLAGLCAGAFSALVCGKTTFIAFQNSGNACIAEMIYTFVLCFVVLGIATVKQPASSAFNGLTVGLCVVAGGNAAGSFSGGHLNPAVSAGLLVASLIDGQMPWEAFAKYILSQIVGGILAAVMFRAIFVKEFITEARERHEKLLNE